MARAERLLFWIVGEPVKIVDLARDLIELSGLKVGKDIDVVSVFNGISKLVAAADEGKTDEMRECLAGLLPHVGWDISSTGGPRCTTVGGMQIAAVERQRVHAGSDAR